MEMMEFGDKQKKTLRLIFALVACLILSLIL